MDITIMTFKVKAHLPKDIIFPPPKFSEKSKEKA